jgi:anti-sigma regulatory factor (Ser/Thr protein kinase)
VKDAAVKQASIQLEPHAEMVAPARRFVVDHMRRWGLAPSDDLELLTSEAVTNAVCHAQTDVVELSVERDGDRVVVAVRDDDPTRPALMSQDPSRLGGLGVRLIHTLSNDWGVSEIHDDGKRVWFELDVPEI